MIYYVYIAWIWQFEQVAGIEASDFEHDDSCITFVAAMF